MGLDDPWMRERTVSSSTNGCVLKLREVYDLDSIKTCRLVVLCPYQTFVMHFVSKMRPEERAKQDKLFGDLVDTSKCNWLLASESILTKWRVGTGDWRWRSSRSCRLWRCRARIFNLGSTDLRTVLSFGLTDILVLSSSGTIRTNLARKDNEK